MGMISGAGEEDEVQDKFEEREQRERIGRNAHKWRGGNYQIEGIHTVWGQSQVLWPKGTLSTVETFSVAPCASFYAKARR